MKRIIKIAAILIVVAVIFGCRKEPEIPEPATPKGLSYQIQDGSIFFSWFPAKDALSYGMEIARDEELADLVFNKEGIEDTFQLVSCDSFEFDSTYYWRVRAEGEAGWGEWSDVASFTYSSTGALDLDTTYFPFGLGYEWCFERRRHGYNDYESWDSTYIITITVIDSSWTEDTLWFSFDGGGFRCIGGKIWKDTILAAGYLWMGYFEESISLIDPANSPVEFIDVSCQGDTFVIYVDDDSDPLTTTPIEGVSQYERRIKEIGTVSQGITWYGSWYRGATDDRLLYFYNGVDTVYKADDWGEVIEVDLDTTYFPLGQGYEWTYQRHSWGWKEDSTITWDDYDTFTVNVFDSFWVNDTLKLSFADTKPVLDLGTTALVLDGKVRIEMWQPEHGGAFCPWVHPNSPEIRSTSPTVEYLVDTLKISYGHYPGDDPIGEWREEWTKRIRGIGPVQQGIDLFLSAQEYQDEILFIADSLISFTTPEGQVWP